MRFRWGRDRIIWLVCRSMGYALVLVRNLDRIRFFFLIMLKCRGGEMLHERQIRIKRKTIKHLSYDYYSQNGPGN